MISGPTSGKCLTYCSTSGLARSLAAWAEPRALWHGQVARLTAVFSTGLAGIRRPRRGKAERLLNMMKTILLQGSWRGLLAFAAIAVLVNAPARAENLDQGKSGAKLFADTCVTCHRSARGLAKGRFSVTLYPFLQQHYASNGNSAWALTSYLESLDDAPRSRSRAASAKPGSSPAAATSAPQSSLRPPAPVPQRGHLRDAQNQGTGSSGAASSTIPQAPIGHRQPRADQVPSEKSQTNPNDIQTNPNDILVEENAILDRKMKSICRGC
jgi:mono/diheme cytochrome c family protein